MTDESSIENQPDNRLWAVLFLAVFILSVAFLDHFESGSAKRAAGPHMMLHDNGSELEWLPESEVGRAVGSSAVRAELTPFFFAPVPVNSAGREILTTLPGIGPGMAGRIIDFRTANGPITNAETFLRIPGIGNKRLESLQPYISFQ